MDLVLNCVVSGHWLLLFTSFSLQIYVDLSGTSEGRAWDICVLIRQL